MVKNNLTIVHLPSNSRLESHWQVGVDCPECSGQGTYDEVKTGVYNNTPYVDYYERRCEHCNDGQILYVIHRLEYDSCEDLQEDYPNSNVTLYIKEM